MKTTKSILQVTAILLSFVLINACQPNQKAQEKKEKKSSQITRAICVLHPTEGNTASGIVTFTPTANGIKIEANMSGLTPGKHGFHIHEWGDCSSLDAKSAGGHFNPDNEKHGGPNDTERHAGDLGNIEADSNGNANLTLVDNRLSFRGKYDIIGRGIIVHADEDDLTSQPTGNAGARVACGVIGIAGEEK